MNTSQNISITQKGCALVADFDGAVLNYTSRMALQVLNILLKEQSDYCTQSGVLPFYKIKGFEYDTIKDCEWRINNLGIFNFIYSLDIKSNSDSAYAVDMLRAYRRSLEIEKPVNIGKEINKQLLSWMQLNIPYFHLMQTAYKDAAQGQIMRHFVNKNYHFRAYLKPLFSL